MSMQLLETRTLTDTAASIEFTSIPQYGTDLLIKASLRDNQNSAIAMFISFNGSTSNFSSLYVYGNGSTVSSSTLARYVGSTRDNATSNTFNNTEIYIPNYAGSTNKPYSVDNVTENNGTVADQNIIAGLWANTSPITSLSITPASGSWRAGSVVSLYTIGRKLGPGITPKAVGGWTNQANGYWYHTFTGSGSFTPLENMSVEYLVIGGGGGGGFSSGTENGGGAGGAGGYRSSVIGELSGGGALAEPVLQITSGQVYPIVIGAGGAPQASGTNSTFSSITSTGGGRGATNGVSGDSGGSGGGGGGAGGSDFFGGSGTSSQGYRGGYGGSDQVTYRQGGGGGGAGGPGEHHTNSSNRSSGGRGLPSSITGTVVRRAGGGSIYTTSIDGGGVNGVPGVANTGGGGHGMGNPPGGSNGGAGGSGVVIIRYKA
jgi:hypothetical protein